MLIPPNALIVGAIATFATIAMPSARAGAWTLAGPADAGYAAFTHPAVGSQAIVQSSRYLFVGRTFSTQDGGAGWDAAPALVAELALSGTPTMAFTVSNDTMHRSADFGRTWAPVAALPYGMSGFDRVRVHPTQPGEWVAASATGVWHTRDSGATWSVVEAPPLVPARTVRALAVDWDARRVHLSLGPSGPIATRGLDDAGGWTLGGSSATLLVAAHGVAMYMDGAGTLVRSADGGTTFQPVAQALGKLDLCDLRFSAAPASRVYALDCTTGRTFRSNDDGATWTAAATLAGTFWGSRLAIDAANPDRLYVGTTHDPLYAATSTIMRSDDGATSFHPLERSTGAPGSASLRHFDVSDPSRQWLAPVELAFLVQPPPGFGRTVDGGATWSRTGGDHRFLGVSRYRTNTVFGALRPDVQGDRDFSVSRDGGETWSAKLGAEERYWRFDFLAYGAAPNELFVYGRVDTTPYGTSRRIYYSTTDGNSFVERTAPPLQLTLLTAAPSGPTVLYAGGGGSAEAQLYRSTDASLTWQPVAFFPSPFGAYDGFLGNTMTAFAIDPVDPKRLYAGFQFPDHVMRSEDAGATWTRATSGLGAGWITSLAVDPASPSTIYATQFGSGVFRSTDRGQSWFALDEGMHEDTPLRVHIDPFVTGRVYASTMSGLFRADLSNGVPAGDRRAIEYYHQHFDHYFVTADADEAEGLDAGVFEGWSRTGEGFRTASVTDALYSPVCRFFGLRLSKGSSHFYTPYPAECTSVKSDPAWLYEKLAFGLALPEPSPVSGCRTGTRPLYRLWNGDKGAPNHRYTTSGATSSSQEQSGWIPEGEAGTRVFACVPY
jgi:photosystem II stability/assembly factor-like uncharacterized protein